MAMSKSPLALKPDDHQSSSSSSASTSQPASDAKMHPLPSSSKARRNSLRLSLQQTPPVPIPPPSLLQSPYLTATKVHREPATTSHIPSQEDDFWLQDQVPLSVVGRRRTLPAQPRESALSVRQQSPPLTPPVRPHSVLAPGGNGGVSYGDWGMPPSSSGLDYPFPSPSAQWRKSSSYTSRPRSDALSPTKSPPSSTTSYFSDLNSPP